MDTITITDEKGFITLTGENEIQEYLESLRIASNHAWDSTYKVMSKFNVDLSWTHKPLLDTTYKSMMTNKKVRLVIIDDESIVKRFSKTADVIVQLWDRNKRSLILGLNIREDAHINWRGEELPLSKVEKVLTSWLLNVSEGELLGPFPVVDDVVKSVADKNLFGNVFSVLN